MNAFIRYHSGTGNTARAAGLLAAQLGAAGWVVDSCEVRQDTLVSAADGSTLLVLACPTLGFAPPRHFLRWVRHLPRVERTRGARPLAAIVAVCGATTAGATLIPGYAGAVGMLLGWALRHRGHRVVSVSQHSYPVNWTQLFGPLSQPDCQRIRLDADRRLADTARGWIEGRAGPKEPAWGFLLLPVAVLFLAVAGRILGKLYAADQRCTACGLCAAACPSRTVTLVSERPVWGGGCDGCNRCLNLCPARAIQVSAARLALHGAGPVLLAVVALAGLGLWGWAGAVLVFAAGTLGEFTLAEAVVRRLERHPRWGAAFTWGWTTTWGRYLAPGFTPGSTDASSDPGR